MVSIYEREGAMGELEKAFAQMLKKNPEMSALVALTAIINDISGIPVIDECVDKYLLNEPTLSEFVDIQGLTNGDESGYVKIRKALSKLASSTPRYQCQECGFSSQKLLWQCPSCRAWETQRPASRVQFDTVLQHSIT